MNQSAIFNVKDILVNELIGDVTLFGIIGIIMIWLLGSKAGLPLKVMIVFTIAWVGLCYSFYASFIGWWILAITFVGFTFYYQVAKELGK